MSTSKYHEDDRVLVNTKAGKKMVKRTSVSYKAAEKETPYGTAIIRHDAVYKKESDGHIVRIDRKSKPGKAGRKAERRAKQAERSL